MACSCSSTSFLRSFVKIFAFIVGLIMSGLYAAKGVAMEKHDEKATVPSVLLYIGAGLCLVSSVFVFIRRFHRLINFVIVLAMVVALAEFAVCIMYCGAGARVFYIHDSGNSNAMHMDQKLVPYDAVRVLFTGLAAGIDAGFHVFFAASLAVVIAMADTVNEAKGKDAEIGPYNPSMTMVKSENDKEKMFDENEKDGLLHLYEPFLFKDQPEDDKEECEKKAGEVELAPLVSGEDLGN